MLMNEMKRLMLERLKLMDGKWRSMDLITMTSENKDIPLAQRSLVELNEDGVIERRTSTYGRILVTEYRYLCPPPPKLKVVK